MARTVWITGGSRGIGAAAVRAFAEAGWRVAFTYLRSRETAAALMRAALQDGLTVRGFVGDMAVRADVERCAGEMTEAFGFPDALVCNAGVAQQKLFRDITDSDWDAMMDGNARSVYYAVQAVYDGMVRRKSGSIVTVSSVWGVTGASCESHYAASKAAVIGLTRSLAQELGPSGVRVNCVAPGVIATDMNAQHAEGTLRALSEETPLGRLGTPGEVAEAILFLCDTGASFITGQVLGVSGGFAM